MYDIDQFHDVKKESTCTHTFAHLVRATVFRNDTHAYVLTRLIAKEI